MIRTSWGGVIRYHWATKLGILLFFLFAFQIEGITANKEVLWPIFDDPPAGSILQGPYKGQGRADLLGDFFQRKLPEYHFKRIEMNFSRFFAFVEDGKTICAFGTDKTPERERILYFSIPALITVSDTLIIRKDLLHTLGGHKEISLAQLIERKNLRGVFVRGKSYTPIIDAIIARHSKEKQIEIGNFTPEQMLKMLVHNRKDYMVGEPSTINFLAYQLGLEGSFSSVFVQEMKPYRISYCTCSKTGLGAQVIASINHILRNERRSEIYLNILSRWDNQNGKQLITKISQQAFDLN